MNNVYCRPAIIVAAIGFAVAVSTAPADAAGMLVSDGGLGGVLEIEEHTADVTINNGIAVTHVTQVFRNTENRQVEALYLFPVPKGASVANFSMWIDGKEMIGEVVEKERAREIYNSYKRVRRDPGLLEQVDYKNFEMRIFPIGPGAEQRVQITYYQELDFDHNWATYVYPLATAPRPGLDARTRGKFGLSMHVKSEIPIQSLESPSHGDEFIVVPHSDHYYEASLETDEGDLSRDLVLAYQAVRPHTGIDVITSREPGEDGYFQLTLTAGDELAEAYTGMDYVFVLDISGSMARDGKLRMSRESIDAFVTELGPEDRFELIAFNVAPQTLFDNLQEVTEQSQTEAIDFLQSQQGRGGTVLRPAMATAYKYIDDDRPLNVVVLSDGMTEQSERRELLQLIAARPSGARVFCIGVGNEVNRPLLSQIADEAGGLAAFLSPGDDFQRQAKAFRRKLLRPAATDVTIEFDGADVYDLEPRELPDLYHGMPLRLYGRYRQNGDANVNVKAEVNGSPIDQTVAITLPDKDAGHPQIERMWASRKVDRLLREGDRQGSRSGVIDEIVRLGEQFSIVTEYTSFLVLENDAEYRRWKIDRRNFERLGRDRAQQRQLQAQLQSLRERALAKVGPNEVPSVERPQPRSSQPSVQNLPAVDAQSAPLTPSSSPRSRDLQFAPTFRSGGTGGGALDPISGGIAVTLAGLALAARRRRDEHDDAASAGVE